MKRNFDRIELRAHHGMCLSFFEGKGYSEGFTSHMQEIQEELRHHPAVRLVDGADAICERCPNDEGGICVTEQKVQRYDRQVLALCGLKAGDEIKWEIFEKLVFDKILRVGKREEICGDCEWNDICAADTNVSNEMLDI